MEFGKHSHLRGGEDKRESLGTLRRRGQERAKRLEMLREESSVS